jgi:NTP pyrophosphatase (non-canonical NTP hydrolase)
MDKTIATIMSFWSAVGLYKKGSIGKQRNKIREEFQEVCSALYEHTLTANDETKQNLEKEIGDLFTALLNFSEMVDLDLEMCAKLSHHKNKDRKYYMKGDECVRDK